MNQYMDPENYGPGVTFDLFKAINDYLETLDKSQIVGVKPKIDTVVDFLNSNIAPSRDTTIYPKDLAEFKTDDARNYIKNIFDAATGLGMPETDFKYGNTSYIKDLVDQVFVNLETGIKVSTDILNEADPLKSILEEATNITNNIREEFPAEPTSELRMTSYLKALNDADVIDNNVYKQMKDYTNWMITKEGKFPASPELAKITLWYIDQFPKFEAELITGSPTYDVEGKTNFATEAYKVIDAEYQSGSRSIDTDGTNTSIRFRTPGEILSMQQTTIDTLTELQAQGMTDYGDNLTDVIKSITNSLDHKGFRTSDYEQAGLTSAFDVRIKDIAGKILEDVRGIADPILRWKIIIAAADEIIDQSGNFVQAFENNKSVENMLSNITGFKAGNQYIRDLFEELGIDSTTISEEDITLLAQEAKNFVDIAMQESEDSGTVPDFRKLIIDNVLQKLPTMQKQKTNFDILSDDKILKATVGQSLLKGLGYSDSASIEVKRYLSEIVAPGFENFVRGEFALNPAANIDEIIFSGINKLKTGMDVRLTDAGLTASDIDPASLGRRLADDETLFAMGVDPATGEVSTTMSPRPRQKDNIDPLGFESAIAGLASDDMGFMNFLLSNQGKIQADYLKAKEAQVQPDPDEFAALGNAVLRASFGLKPGEDIPSYPGGSPPGTFKGEGGKTGKFPAMEFPVLKGRKETEGLMKTQQAAAQFAFTALEKPEFKVSDYLVTQRDTLRGLYEKSPEFLQSKFRGPRSQFGGLTYTRGRA